MVRNYIETLVNLPWSKKTKDQARPDQCRAVLNEDHYGLDKVKERILSISRCSNASTRSRRPSCAWLALLASVRLAGAVDCQGDWPQVRAHGLGWVRDEAEIRGHRRTYIGSMPGKVLQSLSKVGTTQPIVPAGRDRQAGHGLPR